MPHVEEINRVEQLAGYRLLWGSLLPHTRQGTFFQSLDWLRVYWRHFGRDQGLRVLIVHSADEPVGILPLVVRTEKTRIGRVRVLGYPLDDWGAFYGPVGPNATVTLLEGLRHVRHTRRDWDLLDLRWVDLRRCDYGRTERAMLWSGFRPHRQPWAQTNIVELEGTWDDYWAGLNPQWRETVDDCYQNMAREGELTHIRYRPEGQTCGEGDPRWDLYDACTAIARRSPNGHSAGRADLTQNGASEFLRDAHAAAAQAGAVDVNLLLWNDAPVAFAYNYHYRGRVCGVWSGHDPGASEFQPAVVLRRLMLEDGFARGDAVHDLGAGSLEADRPWATRLATSFRYTHFPPAVPRAQILRLTRWFHDRLFARPLRDSA